MVFSKLPTTIATISALFIFLLVIQIFLCAGKLFVWLQSQVENTGGAIKYIVFANCFMSAERQSVKGGNNQVSWVNNQLAAYSLK
jgi:hypothetical protein